MKIFRIIAIILCAIMVLVALKNAARDALLLAHATGDTTSYLIGRLIGSITIGILLTLLITYLWRKNAGPSRDVSAPPELRK